MKTDVDFYRQDESGACEQRLFRSDKQGNPNFKRLVFLMRPGGLFLILTVICFIV